MGAGRLEFLPARLIRFPAAGWDRAALGRAHRLRAAVLVADVHGFTRRSEVVARSGPAGTEQLSDTVNAVFAPIVDLVHGHGGEVGLFVGDSVVSVFADGEAALACAAALPAPGGLSLSVGLAAGTLVSTVVGDPAGRLEHVLFGDVLARAAAAAARAGPGATVAEPLPVRGPPLEPRRVTGARRLVAPFLHPRVAARLDAGREPLLAEHRRVTSLFCRFADLSADDPAAGGRLQGIVAAALEVLARFDGALLQVELVDKGPTLKATFGAPLAHEDDERRAIACARALLARPELPGAAIGLATGTVLCGLIGAPARREYTVLGDAVNVAARLMLAARPGQILATVPTREPAGAEWEWEPRGPFALRGRREPVAAFEPARAARAPRRRVAARHPLVGRERELAELLAARERARGGAGGALIVSGEAGIGKSRLLEELVARSPGFAVLRGGGGPSGRDLAYGAWREAGAALAGAAGEPLLAPLLGRAPADGLDPQHRAEAVSERVVALVRARAATEPVLLAFEDAQWLDGPSRTLLERLGPELPRLAVLLVVTVRPGGASPRLADAATLRLDGLPPPALARLVRGRGAPPAAVAAIVDRCGGNPLFAEELTSLARRHGGGPLPDSVRAAITARLDALGEREHATARVASVIGARFAAAELCGSDAGLGGADEVASALAALADADLVRPDGRFHVFKHAVTREVAYATLAVAAREHLHRAVAAHLERTGDLKAPDVLDALAHHYGETRETAKQRIYLRRAGDAARDAFANETAVRHYRRLRQLASGSDAVAAALDLGAVLRLTGAWTEAEAIFRGALAVAGSAGAAARARAALGGLLADKGALPEAVALLEDARAGFAALGDGAELARVLERLGHVYFEHGDDARATGAAREHLALARARGDAAGESTALDTLALVAWHRGELEPAREQLERALALAREAGHRVGAVHLLNDLAGVLVALGRNGEALARLSDAYAAAREIGYRRFQGAVVANAAELLRGAGATDAALACAARSLEIGAALGDALQVVHDALVIAALRAPADPPQAVALLTAAAGAAEAAGLHRQAVEARESARVIAAEPVAVPAAATLRLDDTLFDGIAEAPDPGALTGRAIAALAALRAGEVSPCA